MCNQYIAAYVQNYNMFKATNNLFKRLIDVICLTCNMENGVAFIFQ